MGEVNEEFKAIMARFNAKTKDCSGLGNSQPPAIGKPPTVPASPKPRPTVSTIQSPKYSSDSGHPPRPPVSGKLDPSNGPFKHKGISAIQNAVPPAVPKGPGAPRIYRAETKDSSNASTESSPAAQPVPAARSLVGQKSLFEGRIQSEHMVKESGFKTKAEHVQDNINWNISQALKKQEKMREFPGNRFRPPLEEQKNVFENMDPCSPKRKPLPSDLDLWQRPVKPKRPPNVDLEKFRKARSKVLFGPPPMGSLTGIPNLKIPKPLPQQSHSRPGFIPHLPERPSVDVHALNHRSNDEQDMMYDDAETVRSEKPFFPPAPPVLPPKPANLGEDSLSEIGSSIGEKDSDGDDSECYETVDRVEKDQKPGPKTDKTSRELTKEQKERQKKENDSRKKFMLTGPIEVIHTANVNKNSRGGKLDLCVKQGDSIEIVRINDNPEGKWLARTSDGTFGYISNTNVDVDYDAVKRKFVNNTKMRVSPALKQTQHEDLYDDVDSMADISRLKISHDEYDDVDPITEDFPPPPLELRMPINPKISVKKSKKEERDEKEFRKKFKFEGEIKVLSKMMVDPNANTKKGGGKDLQLARGEILDVIQFTSSEKYLCRNTSGKYGYAPKNLLLEPEWEIYDDVDHPDIYDND
ncbi:FYN-binding protein 1-like isoform X3 [Protopterus annectens]|uniref:FYN-binding protein 1-like isoform X3 n=1 Tax=Protopterus annectens TaxID=7888 RepID=UPI001CFAB146|nr:FYN-binding protein 1-like isoform X3 [Protopterus annectens]